MLREGRVTLCVRSQRWVNVNGLLFGSLSVSLSVLLQLAHMAPKRAADHVAEVSAASVSGYLRNVAYRHRVPRAEGGKGTRRKVAMVSSTVETPLPTVKTNLTKAEDGEESRPVTSHLVSSDDEGEEWDEVELPSSLKPEVKTAPIAKTEGVNADEVLEVDLPLNAESRHSRLDSNLTDVEHHSSRGSAWRQQDSAYEEMRRRQDELAAQRRFDRVQRTGVHVVELLALCLRGRFLWREGRHPQLMRRLLSFQKENRYPFLSAVAAARPCVLRAALPANAKPSLVPAWVTLEHDGVTNETSCAVMVLLKQLHECFILSAEAEEQFTRWSVPLPSQCLYRLLLEAARRKGDVACSLPHPFYFAVLFLTLAAVSGLEARLVIAKDVPPAEEAKEAAAADRLEQQEEVLTIYGMKKKGGGKRPRRKEPAAADGPLRSKTKPNSCVWVEVWSPERQSFVSVNPCATCSVVWGSPYVFAFAKGRVVDVTARYTSSLSKSYQFNYRLGRCSKYRFLFKSFRWDDTRDVPDAIVDAMNHSLRKQDELQASREGRQLEALRYAEKVPTTLAKLHNHPLFVIESDLSRTDGIYPKDASHTVGSVKGHTVYKRSAVQNLRSRDGWIREGRAVRREEDATPYRCVPPPASRPFSAPSQLFGYWQTGEFAPQPLVIDANGAESLPAHGNTSWYLLLSHAPPAGLAHLVEPDISRVARKMQLHFKAAVIGFERKKIQENRRGYWSANIRGIIVRERDKAILLKAYAKWLQMTEEQAAARRRDRALHWWLLMSKSLLAMDRVQAMYCRGLE